MALTRVPATTGTTSASLPVACPDGTPPADCPSAVLASSGGLQVSAVAGYAEGPPTGATPPPAVAHPPGHVARFTVDTGSIGAVVPGAELGPNVIGPGAPAFKSYEPSGDQYAGYLYLAPLTFMTASGTSTTIPVRVMATYSSGCAPTSTRCTTPPDPSVIHYLGVGFDRATPTPATQVVSPTDNALVQLAGAPGTVSPGYVLSASGVTTGLTPGVVAGFDTVDLTPDPVTPGDFDTAPGSISMTPSGGSTVTAPATILMDTGIGGMFVNSPPATFPPLPADSTVQVTVGTTSPPLVYDFNSGPFPDGKAPVQAGGAPSTMDLIHQAGVTGVFVNTGRHVLYLADFLFEAGGRVGYRPLAPPLR